MKVIQFTCRAYRRAENISYVTSMASFCGKDTKQCTQDAILPHKRRRWTRYVTKPDVSLFRQVTNYRQAVKSRKLRSDGNSDGIGLSKNAYRMVDGKPLERCDLEPAARGPVSPKILINMRKYHERLKLNFLQANTKEINLQIKFKPTYVTKFINTT
jgi:hypothetical protein